MFSRQFPLSVLRASFSEPSHTEIHRQRPPVWMFSVDGLQNQKIAMYLKGNFGTLFQVQLLSDGLWYRDLTF